MTCHVCQFVNSVTAGTYGGRIRSIYGRLIIWKSRSRGALEVAANGRRSCIVWRARRRWNNARRTRRTAMAIKWLIGTPKIAAHMGWSPLKVMRMAAKYGFPLMRLPAATRQGWAYHTNQALIDAWQATQIEQTAQRIAQLKAGKPHPIRERVPAGPEPWWKRLRKASQSPDLSTQPIDNTSD